MAELGGTSALKSEINASPSALAVVEQSIASGGTATATVEVAVTTAHPLVTLVAPRLDRFVGVSGLSLLDAQGEWLLQHQVDLFPYDAVTEEGTELSAIEPRDLAAGNDREPQGNGQVLRTNR